MSHESRGNPSEALFIAELTAAAVLEGMFLPKRRHLTLFANLVRVTRRPLEAHSALKIGRQAVRNGAMQKLSELVPFLALIGHPGTIVEVGAGGGGMLQAFCAISTDDATIVSVDLEGGPFGGWASEEELRNRAGAKPGQALHLVRGDSRDPAIIQQVVDLVPAGIELLFIDGDHSYEGVSMDYQVYSPLVIPGGIIALHDIFPHSQIRECEVDRFWSELTGVEKREIVSPGELATFSPGGTWGGIGIVVTR